MNEELTSMQASMLLKGPLLREASVTVGALERPLSLVTSRMALPRILV